MYKTEVKSWKSACPQTTQWKLDISLDIFKPMPIAFYKYLQ